MLKWKQVGTRVRIGTERHLTYMLEHYYAPGIGMRWKIFRGGITSTDRIGIIGPHVHRAKKLAQEDADRILAGLPALE